MRTLAPLAPLVFVCVLTTAALAAPPKTAAIEAPVFSESTGPAGQLGGWAPSIAVHVWADGRWEATAFHGPGLAASKVKPQGPTVRVLRGKLTSNQLREFRKLLRTTTVGNGSPNGPRCMAEAKNSHEVRTAKGVARWHTPCGRRPPTADTTKLSAWLRQTTQWPEVIKRGALQPLLPKGVWLRLYTTPATAGTPRLLVELSRDGRYRAAWDVGRPSRTGKLTSAQLATLGPLVASAKLKLSLPVVACRTAPSDQRTLLIAGKGRLAWKRPCDMGPDAASRDLLLKLASMTP